MRLRDGHIINIFVGIKSEMKEWDENRYFVNSMNERSEVYFIDCKMKADVLWIFDPSLDNERLTYSGVP